MNKIAKSLISASAVLLAFQAQASAQKVDLLTFLIITDVGALTAKARRQE